MAKPGEGLEEPAPSLLLDQTEAQNAEKIFLETGASFSKGLDDRTPPPPPLLSQGLDPVLYPEKEKAGKNLCTLLVLNVAVAGLSFCVFRNC